MRDRWITTRLHAAERQLIAEAARRRGETCGSYARRVLLDHARRDLSAVHGSIGDELPPARERISAAITPPRAT